MKKGRKIIAAAAVLSLIMGMPVRAAGNSGTTRDLDDYANLSVDGIYIVRNGELTGEMPENVSYDLQTNVLTLDDYVSTPDADTYAGISCLNMGEEFVIRFEGENSITVPSGQFNYNGIVYGSSLTLEGPGSLNISNVEGVGIGYREGLTIDGCTINITGAPSGEKMFYGINGDYTYTTEAVINDSEINISCSKPSGSEASNAGIDVQAGNLTVQNSDISINLTNGNIFGLAVGYTRSDDTVLGGTVSIDGSVIRCITSTDMLDLGDYYNHNMYFYNMNNADQLHYYTSTDNSFIEKSFDETFSHKYNAYPDRYDSNTNTVISSTPLSEYCNHQWDEGAVTTEATCEEPGEKTYTCALCGETKREEIAALGHTWGEWTVIKEAECAVDGAQIRTCSLCNKTETESIPQLGHDFVIEVVKEPTCMDPGEQHKTCSRCGLVIENEPIPATGHDYEWVVEKEATFHEDGIRKGTCSNCGDVITERIPMLSESHEHDFSGREEIIKPATCTEVGTKYIYCTEPECGEYIPEIIPMTAHTPGEWETVKEATCSENGLEERNCTVCGNVIETRVTDTLPHTYDEWVVTVEPTCTEAGVESASCTVCGETAVRGINPLGHDFAEWDVTKEASCTADGEETSTCTRCGEVSSRVIEAEGHSYGEWEIVKEPTLTETGERQTVCSVCGDVKTETMPKLSELQPTVPDGGSGNADADNNGAAASDTKSDNPQSPQTGDSAPIALCALVVAVSAGAIVVTARKR